MSCAARGINNNSSILFHQLNTSSVIPRLGTIYLRKLCGLIRDSLSFEFVLFALIA